MKSAFKKIFASRPARQAALVQELRQTGLVTEEWYQKTYPEVAKAQMDPVHHYLTIGTKKGFRPNPVFDAKWYHSTYKAARKFDGPALLHYTRVGWKKGNSPAPGFSVPLYLKTYADVAASGMEPLRHFLHIGRYSGYLKFDISLQQPARTHKYDQMLSLMEQKLFDPVYYRRTYSDIKGGASDALSHFVQYGRKEKRNPNPWFNTAYYTSRHWRSITGKDIPVLHYAREGHEQGYDPHPDFSTSAYKTAFPDIDWQTTNPLTHFFTAELPDDVTRPADVYTRRDGDKPDTQNLDIPVDPLLRTMAQYTDTALAPLHDSYNPASLDIHWVIPDFAPGGGGHMTIFRMISKLEFKGHRQTVWIHNPTRHASARDAYETIVKYFQNFTGTVRFLDDGFEDAAGDVIIATDCWTVYPVMSTSRFLKRFYFVQDFEPAFHPVGSHSLAAEQTYHKDIDCICAGPWLSGKMQHDYGRWAAHFYLAADTHLYHPPAQRKDHKVKRIAVYARHFTARRAVELAFLALEHLAKSGVKFRVEFFGAPLPFDKANFEFTNHGVLSPEQLARLFQKADIGLVFSATNYSLVPQEMMACGLPIVEMSGENTRCIFPADTVTLADPHPRAIMQALQSLIEDSTKRKDQAKTALEWVRSFCWDDGADRVETALLTRLGTVATAKPPTAQHAQPVKASVVIPTWNAGPAFEKILQAITEQKTNWPYEILLIDSGSTDETLDIAARFHQVKVHQIPHHEFNHGGTRNLGVELTSGEYIAFLTHDALPANAYWLHNLVSLMDVNPDAAGAFGAHLPWPGASDFTKRDLNAHFENLKKQPLILSRDTNKALYDSGDTHWRQVLHFYSDNNSCMRRSVWQEIPYRAIKYGEDQVWADDIIKAGHSKLFAPQAVVYHSHDYDEAETFDRAKTESAFFKYFFDYDLIKDEAGMEKTLNGLNAADAAYAETHGIADADLTVQHALNTARLKGYLAGNGAACRDMFEED